VKGVRVILRAFGGEHNGLQTSLRRPLHFESKLSQGEMENTEASGERLNWLRWVHDFAKPIKIAKERNF
jgi:hypothetical protein